MFRLTPYLKKQQQRIDRAMDRWLPKRHDHIEVLVQAMRYSMFSSGKRLRPILVLAAAEACGRPSAPILPAALALECIHTYSLIHDDLPAMDDDDMRRGQPTCHKKYGEANAILAGDALLTYAFELMTKIQVKGLAAHQRLVEAIQLLAQAAGMRGMVGGQVADVQAEGREIDLPTLQFIHTHKTGYLIMAACRMGGLLSRANASQLKALTTYGECLGLAFQIADDVLNVVGKAEKLGKQTGTDERRGKATYPALLGLEASRAHARGLMNKGIGALKPLGAKATPLLALADYIINREV